MGPLGCIPGDITPGGAGRANSRCPLERLILGVALAWPTWGGGRIAAHLAREFATHVAPATVQRFLRRSGLPRRRDRLALREHHSAGTCGLLTDRTRRQLARARGTRSRHVHATQPGELVCLDIFYNAQRPHQGYRLRGRTPAEMFAGLAGRAS
jgi:hypothetical protein